MADATYGPAIQRDSDGDRLVVTSSGKLVLESGSSFSVATDLEIASGGTIALASGSSMTIASGSGVSCSGPIAMNTGGYVAELYQAAASTATTINAYGITKVIGSTAGPTYLISNPIAGVVKYISLDSASSGATNRAIIAPASTATWFDGIPMGTTGFNQITLNTTLVRGITLVGVSTANWRVVGTFSAGAAVGNRTT